MIRGETAKRSNPFRKSATLPFLCGEPQEEALARIEYLKDHGAGWCLVTGSPGIGKSSLLTELARRAFLRGESCCLLPIGLCDVGDWLFLVADAWRIPVAAASPPMELRRRLEEHLVGLAALNRPVWILVDELESLSPEWIRGFRWLVTAAAQRLLTLTVVVAGHDSPEQTPSLDAADLRLELWRWEEADCARYVQQVLSETENELSFSDDAISALHERTSGVPRELTHLCEWVWLAAQAELMDLVDSDLVHAVADELSPSAPPRSSYDHSAAYGAW